MIHPRYITFTNAEIVERDPLHKQLGELADFLWTDPRPQAEGKFQMRNVAKGWCETFDEPNEALSRCGTAACACGWEILRSGDRDLFVRTACKLGGVVQDWMFGGHWQSLDNSPFGASYRIDHYLKHRNPDAYKDDDESLVARHYPADAFWMGRADA